MRGRRGPKKKEKKPFRENDLGMNIGEILYGESKPHFSRDRLRNRNSINWQQLGDDRQVLTKPTTRILTIIQRPANDGQVQPIRSRPSAVQSQHSLQRRTCIGFSLTSWF